MTRSLLLAAIAWLAAALPCAAQDAAADCDRLAGDPGVALEAIDADAALAACGAALEAAPGDARLSHQYARALERAGRLEDARRLYEWAAADGFAPAEAALQRLAGTAGAPAAEPTPEELQQTADAYAGLAAALRRYAAALPQDPSDPLTLLGELGSDPQALFGWVKDNTRLVPYRGSLRGPRGVLLDRAGNSLDRALLLAALLRGAGAEVRLAHATLSEDQAKALLPATQRVVQIPAAPSMSREELVALFASDPRADKALVEQAADAFLAQSARAAELTRSRVDVLVPVLREAAADAAPAADAALQAAAVAALSDHYWVQQRTGAGWRDLDPDGEALGTLAAAETLDAAKAPEALRHQVTLRLVLELQDDAGRREEKLLEWTGYPPDLIDQPITLSHIPRVLSSVDQLLGAADQQARMMDALDSESAWVPLLQVGDTANTDKLFTRDGATPSANLSAMAATGAAAASGIASAIGALFPGEDPGTQPKKATPTAEWLEIEIRVPGAEPVVQRRAIFDLVGPAARRSDAPAAIGPDALRDRALRLLGVTRIQIAGATPSSLQVARIAVRDLAAIVDGMRAVVASSGPIDLDNLPAAPELPLSLYTFASERLAAAEGGPALASPNVFLQHQRLSLGPGPSIKETIELDIVANGVAAAPDTFAARLAQGVADTVREATIFVDEPDATNAAALHAADVAAGRIWTRLEAGDAQRLEASGVPPDARGRIAADLAAGFVVVAPQDLADAAAAGRLAWWRIDPASGTTLGMLPHGGGAAMVDYAHQIYHFVHKVACAYSLLGAAMSGGEGGALGAAGLAACAVASGAGGLGAKVAGGAGVVGMAIHIFELIHAAHGGGH